MSSSLDSAIDQERGLISRKISRHQARTSIEVGFAVAAWLILCGCNAPVHTSEPAAHTDQKMYRICGVFIGLTSEQGEPRTVICPLPGQYIGPDPSDPSPIPTWLPFWSNVNLRAKSIHERDEIEFDVLTDWDTPTSAVITAARKIPTEPAASSCPKAENEG